MHRSAQGDGVNMGIGYLVLGVGLKLELRIVEFGSGILNNVRKHFRLQDTKTQRKMLTEGFTLCLGAFVVICSPPQADLE